ncbi:hypothetical protein [Metabacillus sp. RGM 3146]
MVSPLIKEREAAINERDLPVNEETPYKEHKTTEKRPAAAGLLS